MNCSGCGSTVRKTSLVFCADDGGKLTRRRVCNRCLAGCITILPVTTRTCMCGALATTCDPCTERAIREAPTGARVLALARELDRLAEKHRREGDKHRENALDDVGDQAEVVRSDAMAAALGLAAAKIREAVGT